jgi:hypothetical protein
MHAVQLPLLCFCRNASNLPKTNNDGNNGDGSNGGGNPPPLLPLPPRHSIIRIVDAVRIINMLKIIESSILVYIIIHGNNTSVKIVVGIVLPIPNYPSSLNPEANTLFSLVIT